MVTALAALEAGVIKPEETVYCPGHRSSGRAAGSTAGRARATARSTSSTRWPKPATSITTRSPSGSASTGSPRWRASWGWASATTCRCRRWPRGWRRPSDWKRERRGEDWLIGDTLNAGIGQGFVLASPLQLAVMTARVALGPGAEAAAGPRDQRRGGADRAARAAGHRPTSICALVRRGMFNVVEQPPRHRLLPAGSTTTTRRMCGKTGTSQVRNITAAERARGVTRNDAPAVGAARPCAVRLLRPLRGARRSPARSIVEHGGGGSAVAAPIARDMLLQALFDGTPPLEAYPANQRDDDPRAAEAAARCAIAAEANDRGKTAGMSYLEYNVTTVPTGLAQAAVFQLGAGAAAVGGGGLRLPDALFGRGRLTAPLGRAADEALRRRAWC